MSDKKPWVRGSMDRVACLPFPGIDGAFLCLSGGKKEDGKSEGRITFIYDAGPTCAEWDGKYGPIQIWWKRLEGWTNGDKEYPELAEKHWFYEFSSGRGHWSQCAVDDEGLAEKFTSGDYVGIFNVLRVWADRSES